MAYTEITALYDRVFNRFENEDLISKAEVLQMIANAPAADVEEVKHGEWLGERGEYECSVCRSEAPDDNYWPSPCCPCCGAKMELKEGAGNG